jgi:hypothetical protein
MAVKDEREESCLLQVRLLLIWKYSLHRGMLWYSLSPAEVTSHAVPS